jgi:hypothetical protein
MKYYIKGDGSYLSLIDPKQYKTFVGPDWANNPKLLEPHFVGQMQSYSGLFWDTNLETDWVVDVQKENQEASGYRKITGSIKVTDGKLAILEYDALSMLAQFEDYTVEKYLGDNVIEVENGDYQVKIVQLNDPETTFPDGESSDFIILLEKTDDVLPPLPEVPWSKL